jgi:hypothetical protein
MQVYLQECAAAQWWAGAEELLPGLYQCLLILNANNKHQWNFRAAMAPDVLQSHVDTEFTMRV